MSLKRNYYIMKTISNLFFIISLFTTTNVLAGNPVVYNPQDSIEVEKWLKEAPKYAPSNELALFFSKKMLNRPYVAFTLERSEKEQLIINLRELDCTTLVENSAALAITARQGGTSFSEFCNTLCRLRYRDGKINDYSSRLHYFSDWIIDNEKKGLVKDIGKDGEYPFTAKQIIDATFMTTNPQYYKHLKNDTAMAAKIAETEKALCGQTVNYIPKALLNKSENELNVIKNGDIIALVTSKKGLEISHVGIAVWQQGKLHLLNASSLKKKVISDTLTLYEYQKTRPTQLGIRVVRLK